MVVVNRKRDAREEGWGQIMPSRTLGGQLKTLDSNQKAMGKQLKDFEKELWNVP